MLKNDLKNSDMTPLLYLKKLKEVKSNPDSGLTKAMLDKELKKWLDVHTKDPELTEQLKRMGKPMQEALEYVLKRKKEIADKKGNDKQEKSENKSSSTAKSAAQGFLAENASATFKEQYRYNQQDELDNDGEEPEPDVRAIQEELLYVAEHSEPGEAVAALVMGRALGESVTFAIKSALLLVKKFLSSATHEERSICLSGIYAVLDPANFNENLDDTLDNAFQRTKEPDLKAQIAHIRGYIRNEKPNESDATARAKEAYSSNATEIANKYTSSSTEHAHQYTAAKTKAATPYDSLNRIPTDIPTGPNNWNPYAGGGKRKSEDA